MAIIEMSKPYITLVNDSTCPQKSDRDNYVNVCFKLNGCSEVNEVGMNVDGEQTILATQGYCKYLLPQGSKQSVFMKEVPLGSKVELFAVVD